MWITDIKKPSRWPASHDPKGLKDLSCMQTYDNFLRSKPKPFVFPKTHDEYNDLLDSNKYQELRYHREQQACQIRDRVIKRRCGYVYIIKSPGNNLYKIGRSIHPFSRVRSIIKQSHQGEDQDYLSDLRLLGLYNCDAYDVELVIHSVYWRYRTVGEWFWLTESQIASCMYWLSTISTPNSKLCSTLTQKRVEPIHIKIQDEFDRISSLIDPEYNVE